MRIARLLMFVAAASAMTMAVPRVLPAQDLGIELGSTAPGAKVSTLDGKDVDLSAYIGKTPVLMEVWAVWCPHCKELEPTLVAAAKPHGNPVKFLGIAVSVQETPDRVKAFVEKHG